MNEEEKLTAVHKILSDIYTDHDPHLSVQSDWARDVCEKIEQALAVIADGHR